MVTVAFHFQAKESQRGTHATGNQSADGAAAPPGGEPSAADGTAEGEASPGAGNLACR